MQLKTKNALIWNLVEKLSIKFVRFFIGIVLARLLLPEDFGLIGMLAVFIALGQTFTESGMAAGLIQKLERSSNDFSTVFVFNFAVSIGCYVILFLFAPSIANFFQRPELVLISRILTLNIVINSLSIVQRTRMIIDFDFKTIAKINFIAIVVSGFCAVYGAFMGYGVWALVIQNLIFAISTAVLFHSLSKWKLSLIFSKKSFNNLFTFGYRLLVSGILAIMQKNLYNIIIGKYYSTADLGYYTRAKGFVDMTEGTISGIIQSVSFPLLSSIQDNSDQLLGIFSRMLRLSAYIVFPTMCLVAILAEPLIVLLFTKKWIFTVPLLQFVALARIFYSISLVNMTVLKSLGRSDLFLKVDFFKIPIILIVLGICMNFEIVFLVIGQLIISFISFIINTYYPGQILGYGFTKQLKDLLPITLLTLVSSITVYFLCTTLDDNLLKIALGSVSMMLLYLALSFLFNFKEKDEIIRIFKVKTSNES